MNISFYMRFKGLAVSENESLALILAGRVMLHITIAWMKKMERYERKNWANYLNKQIELFFTKSKHF